MIEEHHPVDPAATSAQFDRLAEDLWHLLSKGESYVWERPSLHAKKLRDLELKAGHKPERGAKRRGPRLQYQEPSRSGARGGGGGGGLGGGGGGVLESPEGSERYRMGRIRELWKGTKKGGWVWNGPGEPAMTDIRREIRAQIRQGRRMPDQGSSDAADVLRLSRRSLGPFTKLESDRERVRDGETSHRPHEGRDEGRAVARHRASHGVQTGDGGVEDLAAIARSEPVAESRRRCKIQRRNRRSRQYEIRRLIHSVTHFPA